MGRLDDSSYVVWMLEQMYVRIAARFEAESHHRLPLEIF